MQANCLTRSNLQAWGLLLHPQECGIASKAGLLDGAIPLVDAVCVSLAPSLQLLTSNRLADDLRLCRCGARHGGASEALLSHIRTALARRRRGEMSDDRGLKRHGKGTRLLTERN